MWMRALAPRTRGREASQEQNFVTRVRSGMATKPIPPEVQAERAKATADYRNAQQGAIDRIAILRAARLRRDAELRKTQRQKGAAPTAG